MILKNGAIYKGYIINNFRNGYGIVTWKDGTTFAGYWVDDKANGKGKFIHCNGDIFEWNFINN